MTNHDDSERDERLWLERVLTADIPLGGAMGLSVARLDDSGIVLELPLAANVNDKGTAFGGALASAMILAGWSLPRLLIRRAGLKAELVIGRCEIRFIRPVAGLFQAFCPWPDAADCERFVRRLDKSGRASLVLAPEIRVGKEVAASLSAKYAALESPGSRS
jgi:thioesterase domain-containing protein